MKKPLVQITIKKKKNKQTALVGGMKSPLDILFNMQIC